jgi:prophage regulatory protein
LIPLSTVLERICISKTVLYRRINSGEFPKPLSIGRHRIAFVEAEITAWIEAWMQARHNGEGADVRRARALHAVQQGVKVKRDLYS